jgi:hypothetical protein
MENIRTFALNILKNTTPEDIASGIDVPELDPCSLCNDELFLRLIKKPFTILSCGHIFHRACLEKNITNDIEICPVHSCSKPFEFELQDVELREIASYSTQNMSIDGSLENYSRQKNNNNQSQSKKRKLVDRDKSSKLKQLIKELTTNIPSPNLSDSTSMSAMIDTHNFLKLYHEITKAESKNEKTNQEVIQCYYNFGELLSQRFEFHYGQIKNEQLSQIEVNKEVRNYLPSDITENAFKKRIERARKIYFLFSRDHIGKVKIMQVKSFTAQLIGKLSLDDIKYVINKTHV